MHVLPLKCPTNRKIPLTGIVVVKKCGGELSSLGVRHLIHSAVSELFGSCGAAALCVDVLRVGDGRALVRVGRRETRRLRAALALCAPGLRVRAQAASLQALV